ncbi:MAG: glycosyltransferase, partial [Candidatus Hydrothermarchaeota archaeon]|nr:glycosyltransferase [Candidatus Hydrothermarchaeota archaeon]
FRSRLGINEKEQLILFVGRLTWVKGVDTLIQAMPLILKEVPNAKLLILGKGEQEELIRHMVANLGIEKSVILEFKYADEEERILHYAACDAAVFPSKYEPFGIVCTEAMSMGKPAVVGARGVSGLREQVIPSGVARCGFHVNPYDPSDIAKFVIELLKNPDLREEMGKNA